MFIRLEKAILLNLKAWKWFIFSNLKTKIPETSFNLYCAELKLIHFPNILFNQTVRHRNAPKFSAHILKDSWLCLKNEPQHFSTIFKKRKLALPAKMFNNACHRSNNKTSVNNMFVLQTELSWRRYFFVRVYPPLRFRRPEKISTWYVYTEFAQSKAWLLFFKRIWKKIAVWEQSNIVPITKDHSFFCANCHASLQGI